MFNDTFVDRNENYDKSCKNAMNVIMSKKFYDSILKKLTSGSKFASEINIKMSCRVEKRKKKNKSKFLQRESCHW